MYLFAYSICNLYKFNSICQAKLFSFCFAHNRAEVVGGGDGKAGAGAGLLLIS